MRKGKILISLSSWLILSLSLSLLTGSYAASERTAGEVLGQYSHVSMGERRRALEVGAKREGMIAYYGTTSVRDATILIDSFQKRYPYLSVGHIRGGASPLLGRILSEYRGGKREVDVVITTGTGAFVLIERGLIDPYFPPERNMIRSDLISSKGLWVSHEQYLFVVGYNTRLVSAAHIPKSYGDLLDNRWTDSLSLDQTDYDWLQGLASEWGEAKAIYFLKNLMQLKPKLYRGRELRAQMLAAGEFSISPTVYDYRVRQLKALGAPIDAAVIDPIMISSPVLMLARYAPHPHAAALFIDWLLSEEGQATLESKIGRNPVRKGMGAAIDQMIEGRAFKVLTPEVVGPESDHYIKLYREIVGK